MSDLSEELRPKSINGFYGQAGPCVMVGKWLKEGVPGAILFQGPSGTGKTSMARLIASSLMAQPPHDYQEINAADERGIDRIRTIGDSLAVFPLDHEAHKVITIDEAHKLTADAQSAMMKILEDMRERAHVILCTTTPSKLIKTVRDRCAKVDFKAIDTESLRALLQLALKKVGKKCTPDVQAAIIEAADGSARLTLKLLEGALLLPAAEQIEYVTKEAQGPQVIDLCRELVKESPSWKTVAKILQGLEADPEGIRRAVLGYCNSCLLGNSPSSHHARVMHAFREPLFDAGSARHLLTLACFDAIYRK